VGERHHKAMKWAPIHRASLVERHRLNHLRCKCNFLIAHQKKKKTKAKWRKTEGWESSPETDNKTET
jgi:hypothetical protein